MRRGHAPILYSLAVVASGGLAPTSARAETAPGTLQEALGDPADLAVTGSVRLRYEAIDGQFRPGLADASRAVLLQTDLLARYETGPVVVVGEVLDARAYGGGTGSSLGTGEVNALELVQAHLAFNLGDALGAGTRTSLKAGRFTLDIGSRRLVARNNFRNTTNAFTGFAANFEGRDGARATLFYTLPTQRLPDAKADILNNRVRGDRQGFDLTFWGADLTLAPGRGTTMLEGYYFGLDETDSPQSATRNRHLRTVGLRLSRPVRAGHTDFELEGAWQYGSIRASTAANADRLDVAAWFVHAQAGYRLAGGWTPRLSVLFDAVSGDGGGERYGRFDTLFGARRFEFGPTSLYGALGRANIVAPGVKLEVSPSKRLDAFVAWRPAWLESARDSFSSTGVRSAAGDAGTFAGHQFEWRVRDWIVPGRLQVEAGGAVLVNGRFLNEASNANGDGDTRYGYASATWNF